MSSQKEKRFDFTKCRLAQPSFSLLFLCRYAFTILRCMFLVLVEELDIYAPLWGKGNVKTSLLFPGTYEIKNISQLPTKIPYRKFEGVDADEFAALC